MLLQTTKARVSSCQIHFIILWSSHLQVLPRVASHRCCEERSHFSIRSMNYKTERALTVEAPYVNLSEPCFMLSWSCGFLCAPLSSIPTSCGKLLSLLHGLERCSHGAFGTRREVCSQGKSANLYDVKPPLPWPESVPLKSFTAIGAETSTQNKYLFYLLPLSSFAKYNVFISKGQTFWVAWGVWWPQDRE